MGGLLVGICVQDYGRYYACHNRNNSLLMQLISGYFGPLSVITGHLGLFLIISVFSNI